MFNPWLGKIPWRRERLATPLFWPGEFHGLYSLWSPKESDTTERLSLSYIVTQDLVTFTFIHSNYFPKSRVWKKQGESDFAGENLTNTTLPGAQGQCQGEADNLGFNTSLVRRKRQDPDRAILYTMPDQHYSKLSRSWKISSV